MDPLPPNVFAAQKDTPPVEQADIAEAPSSEMALEVPWDGEGDLEVEVSD